MFGNKSAETGNEEQKGAPESGLCNRKCTQRFRVDDPRYPNACTLRMSPRVGQRCTDNLSCRLQIEKGKAVYSSLSGLCCNSHRTFSDPSFDKEELHRRFREPPGFVASQRWLTQRPFDQKLAGSLFTSSRNPKNSTDEDRFLAASAHATLSGAPTTGDFSYEEVKVIGDVPHLDFRLHENLSRMGLDYLTPVQRHAIGIMSIDETVIVQAEQAEYQRIVGKYDLMAAAQTGSGKTLAYLIPIVNRLLRIYPYESMQARLKSDCQFPSSLIVAPTRELVQQILSEVVKLCHRSFLRPVCVYGGERPPRQLHQISLGCHLLVATPGRLLDFLHQKAVRLDHCRQVHFCFPILIDE
ncbi:ATP-dependent RNA helicase DDX3X [Fasciolopsis buskii]|uniref:ATP-dependent RNA helicase n=1 Tax=Fasciolopsis buskii TaxID=27845 RepID=A0A8E0RVT0_9TREM|nr:ATP-dependent RNA helicase DDX3X [Fasciolopsis buski]